MNTLVADTRCMGSLNEPTSDTLPLVVVAQFADHEIAIERARAEGALAGADAITGDLQAITSREREFEPRTSA